MYQDISEHSFSVLLDGTDTSTQINLGIVDLDNILPHPPMEYAHQSILETNPIPTQHTEIDTNIPNSFAPITNQPNSFQTSPKYCTQQWGDNRFQIKQEAVNATHIADSTKGKIVKSNHRKNKQKIIIPSTRGYSRKTPKPSKDPHLNKNSQTNLSFSIKQDTIESSRYYNVHQALSKLESMPKPEKKPNNGAGYVLRTQKDRQMILQELNIEIAEINKTESQRYYDINCARNYALRENPIDSS